MVLEFLAQNVYQKLQNNLKQLMKNTKNKLQQLFRIVIFVFLCFNFNAQIKYQASFNEALTLAKKDNKLVFVKFYGETCSHCKQLQQALDFDTVSKSYSENFVSFKINSEDLTEVDQAFLKKYKFNIDFIPYMFFFDANGEFIHFATPSQTKEAVLKVLNDVLNVENRSSALKTNYENGKRDVLTLKSYSKLAQLLGEKELIDQLGDDLFLYYQKDDLQSKASFLTLAKYIKSIENGLFRFWITNYEKLDSLLPEFKLEDKQKVLKDILLDDMNENKSKWSIEQLEKAREYVKITKLSLNYYTFTWQEEIEFHSKNEHEIDVILILNEITNLEKNYSQLNYIFEEVLKRIKMKSSFIDFEKNIQNIEKQFITIEEIAKLYELKLKLYIKSNETEKFNKVKLEAETFYKKNNLDFSKSAY